MAQAVTLQALAEQLEALNELCPVLLPSVVPQGFDDQDLWGLVDTEGREQQEEFKSLLKLATKQLKQQQQAPVCAVCGAGGVPTCSPDERSDERKALRFTTLPKVDFVKREIHLTNAGFACGTCRALRDAGRYLIFAASCTSSSATPEQKSERQSLAAELCLHLASVNHTSEQIQSNSELLTTWCQEVMARGYALQVLASNLDGWKVVGPGGCPVTQATPGLSVRLLRSLIMSPRKKTKAVAAGVVPSGRKQGKAPPSAAGVVDDLHEGKSRRLSGQPNTASTAGAPKGQKQQQSKRDGEQRPETNGQQGKKKPRPSVLDEAEEQGTGVRGLSRKAAGNGTTAGVVKQMSHQAGQQSAGSKSKKRKTT